MELSKITKLDEKYYCPVFGRRLPVCFVRGEDVYLFDGEGRKYTDFLSGIAVNCLGYSDEGFKKALCGAVYNLMHTSNYFYNENQAKLAKLLCESAGFDNVFLANSGAEAMEGALKLARKHHYNSGKPRAHYVTMRQSFHGRTLATLAATGQEKFHIPFKPMPWEFDYVTPNDISALYAAVCDRTAAVVIEPILGEGGVIEITPEYYRAVRRVCDKNGALMIADEIQTGMGRTGELLASPALGALPDVVVLAKSLGGGVPTGAFLARGEAAKAFAQGDHGSTFGGNHLACAAALYVTDKLVNTDILARVKDTGAYFKQILCDLKQSFCAIADVRGRGLMLGIEFHETANAKDIQKKLLSEGFVTATAGKNTLRFLPPYTIEKAHIDALAVTLETVLGRI